MHVNNIPTYPSTALQTATGASGAGVTLTVAAPGTGLFNYITFLEIVEFYTATNAALLTPTVITSTNLTGSPAWSVDGQLGVVGREFSYVYPYGHPGIKSTTAATGTTFVAPVVTGIIWRITAGFYVAP